MKTLTLLITFISSISVFSQNSYFDSIFTERKAKEIELLNSEMGILNKEDLEHFSGLHYFYIDSNYRVSAKFEKSIGRKFKMPTSTERMPIYRRYGYLKFNLNDQVQQLTVYQNLELKGKKKFKDYYFIPFRDNTSGNRNNSRF